jgi:ectoine hydroxylase-related dioxygenase (phytanoyl-CoA dioxygenase family)
VTPDQSIAEGATNPLPDLEAHLTRIAEDGYTVLPDAIEPDLVDEIDGALLALEHDLGTVPADNLFEGTRTMRVYNLLVHGATFEKIPVHPHVLPVVEAVLDPGLLISSLSSIAIGADEQAQPIHADDQLIPLPRPHVPIICNTMWAITDFTEENGATRVVLGSNLQPDRLSFGPDDTEPATMARGSILFYSGSVYHGGGANRSEATRIGLNITYNVAWLRQEENQYLSVPREVAETLPTDLLRVMGYDRGAYALGYIDDLRDPIEAVRPGIGTAGFGTGT